MSGTSGGYTVPREVAQLIMRTNFDLMPIPPGTWADTGLSMTLPHEGTYWVEAHARAAVSGSAPINAYVSIRLFNVTTGAPLVGTERMVNQISSGGGATGNIGQNNTVPTKVLLRGVPASTVVRLEAMRGNAVGAATAASIATGVLGESWMDWERIA